MKYLFSALLIFAYMLNAGIYASAQGSFPRADSVGEDDRANAVGEVGGGVDIRNPIEAGSLTEFFETIIDVVLVFAVPLIVFFIIYAGFLYVTARGNEGTIQKAHMALLFAVVGGVIILGAKLLISVITGTVETFQP